MAKCLNLKLQMTKKTQNIMIGKAYGAIETMPCPLPPSAAKSFSSFVFSGTKLILFYSNSDSAADKRKNEDPLQRNKFYNSLKWIIFLLQTALGSREKKKKRQANC